VIRVWREGGFMAFLLALILSVYLMVAVERVILRAILDFYLQKAILKYLCHYFLFVCADRK
jgi:hypothetical protein